MQKQIMKAALFTPLRNGAWGLPILWEGEPGIAKTAYIRQVASECGLAVEVLSPGERGEGAFGTVPVPAEADEEIVLSYPRPEWTNKFVKSGRGVIFVDELTSAPPALHPALLGLLLDGRIGGWQAPPGVRRMAACNPVELAAGGYEIPAPAANRVGHLLWAKPTIAQHNAYMMSANDFADSDDEEDESGGVHAEVIDAATEEKRIRAVWGAAYAKAVGVEGGFLSRAGGESKKNACPAAGDPKASRAWPSDRTWEMATRAYASGIVHDLSASDHELFVGAFIGHGLAGELFEYARKNNLPDPGELLDGKVTFDHNPMRLDRTIAMLTACTSTVVRKDCEKRKPRTDALWALVDKLSGTKDEPQDIDIFVPSADALIANDLHVTKAAGPMLTKLAPVLKAAGIVAGRRRA